MGVPEPRKLSFAEAWETTTEFLVDDSVEDEVDRRIEEIYAETGNVPRFERVDEFARFLRNTREALNSVLADIGLPQERFKRIVTLLRRRGMIPGNFDREWDIGRIRSKLLGDDVFLEVIANVLFEGNKDPFLKQYLPKYYREKLNWKEIATYQGRKIKIREAIYRREYANIKGKRIEEKIGEKLATIKEKHGINYGRGRSRMVDVDVDWAVPSIDAPWVIIMASYYETTSSGQTTKARDMLRACERINRINSRNRENRAFVNFVDGVGWLARRRDFERLVKECHYFINLKNLDLLESIILKHVPRRYGKT